MLKQLILDPPYMDVVTGLSYIVMGMLFLFLGRRHERRLRLPVNILSVMFSVRGSLSVIQTLTPPGWHFLQLLLNVKGAILVSCLGVLMWFLKVVMELPNRDEYERTNRELTLQLGQVQKLETMGMLAGGIAHDFNNMLTAILGYTELADEEPNAPHKELAEVCKATLAAARLTQQLLAFGKRGGAEGAVIDLGIMVRETAEILRHSISTKIALEVNVAPGLWKIWMPLSQAEQILVNLAVNARDAMPDGGKLVIEASNSVCDGREWVLLSVFDTGCGMDQETVRKIFEPFFTTKKDGTGIGLSVVRATALRWGGAVEVETSKDKGTCMRVRFPRTPEGTMSIPGSQDTGAERRPGIGTVLLVEDQDSVRQLVAQMLGDIGYKVIEAESGDQAMKVAAEKKIDLMISDIVMPGMSVHRLIDEMRVANPGLKVVVMSGQDKIRVEGVPTLRKPFVRRDLVRCIERAKAMGRVLYKQA